MHVLFVTDIHAVTLPEWIIDQSLVYDLVILGGDYGSFAAQTDVMELVRQKDNVLAVMGNHDYDSLHDRQILDGDWVEFNGFKIGGIGGSLPAGGWPFERDETEFKLMLDKMPKVDIFVSHQPPIDSPVDMLMREEHIGSLQIREYLIQKKPRLSLHGHIHESDGKGMIDKTLVANPGSWAEGHRYAEITITKAKLNVELKHLNKF